MDSAFQKDQKASLLNKMSERPSSPDHGQYPEVVSPPRSNFNIYDSSYEYYQPAEHDEHETLDNREFIPQRSPAPEYQTHPASPNVSATSPNLSYTHHRSTLSSGGTYTPSHSHTNSESGWHSNTKNSTQFSEFGSPQPQAIHHTPITEEKQYYAMPEKIPSRTGSPEVKRKPLASNAPIPAMEEQQPPRRKPMYKRPLCVILALLVLVVVVVAAVVGGVLGSKHSHSSNTTSDGLQMSGDINLSTGGYLNPAYYSHTGAFNGSGVALAAANPGVDQTIYVFYQDYTGIITYKLVKTDGSVTTTFGQINDPSSTPLNGTPISVVAHHPLPNSEVYHVFYIDQNYTLVERIVSTGGNANNSGSALPLWNDGPLTAKKLKTMKANSIGMQACFWNNYYGMYNNNDKYATDAIHLFFATSETSIAQYTWTNGTTSWNFDLTWSNVDGHAGIGCQTWDSWMTEYVFFVDLNQSIAMYWRDNNKTAPSTTSHPTLQWNKIQNVSVTDVHKSSSLGYTTYMLYQDQDLSIRGVNISWGAENTTIGTSQSGNPDIFTIQDVNDNNAIPAVRGTHLSITALRTASNGQLLQAYFQTNGTDVTQFTRDMSQVNGRWQVGTKVV